MTEHAKIVVTLGSKSPALYLEYRVGGKVPQWSSDQKRAMTFPTADEADRMIEELRSDGFPDAKVGLIMDVLSMLGEGS